MPEHVSVDLARLTAEDFEPLRGSAFEVRLPDGQLLQFTLQSVTVHGRPLPTRNAFSLIFAGPRSTPLGQGTYRLVKEQMGILDIFIVPIQEIGDERRYEAIFS